MRKQRRGSVAVQLISAFVFAIRIVQSLYYLNPKFQVLSHLLWLYSPVCVGPGRKPRRPLFSQRGSFRIENHNNKKNFSLIHRMTQIICHYRCVGFWFHEYKDRKRESDVLFKVTHDFGISCNQFKHVHKKRMHHLVNDRYKLFMACGLWYGVANIATPQLVSNSARFTILYRTTESHVTIQ